MSDLIERSAVLDLMRTNWADNDGDTAMQLSIDDVRNLPAAPKPRTGKWKVYVDCEGKTRRCVCDQCGNETDKYTWKNPNFCENCGAKMEGESE